MSFSHRFFLRSLPSLVLLGLAACAGSPGREGVTPTQAHMFAHLDRANEVHDALIRCDLERARAGAKWLATHQRPRMVPAQSDQHVAFIRRYAQGVANAAEIPDAARGAAQMGLTCGRCHEENRVQPRFLIGTAPPTGSGRKSEMVRHIWAADRMWEGLMGPDDYAWSSGAKSLRRGWLSPGDVPVEARSQQRVRELVVHVYELGTVAEAAEEPARRAEVYGEFVATCADCHRLTGAIIR